jgi:hypothetical protein
MNTSKQIRLAAAVLVGGIVVASSACSTESLEQSTAPRSISPTSARLASGPGRSGSSFSDMSRDGTYFVTIDPTVPNTLLMGGSRLEIPASAVCNLGNSSYGPTFWDLPCTPEQRRLQLTVTVSSSNGEGASVDFHPALRFNPLSNVVLTLSAPNVSKQDAKNWVILYCATATSTTSGNGSGGSGSGKDGDKCINESLTDKDLHTFVDYDQKQLFRRIKHFSFYSVSSRVGYVLAE